MTPNPNLPNLAGLSRHELLALSVRARKLAEDLGKREPSIALALANGVKDCSYPTVRHGYVRSFSGRAELTMDDGSKWLAIGHGPVGTPEDVFRDGYIEFRPVA